MTACWSSLGGWSSHRDRRQPNTTVIEVLARAGGIRARGRSKRIKLIRQDGEENLVFMMDLSTVEGLEAARTVVQANDIIYVESNPQIVLRETLAG